MIKKIVKLDTIIFLLFSFVSGFVELGGIYWSIERKYEIVQIVGLGLAYQLGNFVPVPLRINRKMALILISLTIGMIGICCFYEVNYMLCFISTTFLAMVIQFVRSGMKDKVSTTIKRIFRIGGFVFAPFYSLTVVLGVAILAFLVVFLEKINQKAELLKCNIKFINKIMIVHQMHYFGYVYFMIIIMVSGNPKFHDLMYGILFALGWVTYIIVPHVFRKDKYIKYFIIGHTFLAAVLFLMVKTYHTFSIIILWILTGLGGGTVFCIGEINSKNKICSKNDMIFSENIGHIIGVLGGIIAYQITNRLYAPIAFSAVSAILAMSGMLIYGVHKIKNDIVE